MKDTAGRAGARLVIDGSRLHGPDSCSCSLCTANDPTGQSRPPVGLQ
jgi:hypothetical protein